MIILDRARVPASIRSTCFAAARRLSRIVVACTLAACVGGCGFLLAAWLFSIARHKCMDHFRKQHQQVPLEDAQHVAAETDLLQQLIPTERVAALVAQIASLPEAERDLIRLRYVAELSFRDIARLLGRNEDAVKKSLYRLLDRLAGQLETEYRNDY